jgi:hypothetical protein
MWPYWLLFLVPAFQAVTKLKQAPITLSGDRWPALWRIVFVLLALMIGLRHKVGGDWASYLVIVEAARNLSLAEAVSEIYRDPADMFLNWLAAQSGLGLYLVNSVYGVIFTWGLLVFCREQPRPWLALTVAVPYLITVVAMGYARQGVAIGLVMLGLVALTKQSVFKFLFWVALAAIFHKSAVILVPLAVLAGTGRRLWMLLWVGLTAILLFGLLLQESVDHLVAGYIDFQYDSVGAAVRIAMNAVPATLFLLLRKRFQMPPAQRSFWIWMSLGALALVLLLYVSPSSTAVDRVALYWIPLQLFVWSRLPDAMGRPGTANAVWVYAVVAYSAVVYFVWLFFATHALYWMPYQFYPWVWLWQ